MTRPAEPRGNSDEDAAEDPAVRHNFDPWVKRLLQRIGVDGAVGFAVLARMWQLLTGPVTQILLVVSLSKATQDYYYAFSNMLGMQIFVELGLHVVLISVSSHEWSRLSLHNGRIAGDAVAASRLISLGRMMLWWYGIAALIFAVVITLAGFLFFREASVSGQEIRETVAWIAPWIALVTINGLQLPLLPLTAILEGCNQLSVINRVRFWQAVIGTIVVWTTISSGFGLWALVASAAVRLGGETYLVAVRFRLFFVAFHSPPGSHRICWKQEILPLQWRIAVQGILLWLANQMPLLIIFKGRPAGEAAQLGMTWTILTAFQSASLAWIETRRPVFGALIAERKFAELDRLFFRLTKLSMLVMTSAVTAFCMAVWWMGTRDEWLFERLSGRMLPPGPAAMFSAAMVLIQFSLCTNLYVRAHKRDPFLVASIVSSLTVATLEVWLGNLYGSAGVAGGYLLGISLVQVPLWTMIWARTRLEWHRPEIRDA
ncbi:MAG: hypothetical protein ACKO2P_18585 [Planctomycetota bacterium]